MLPKEVAQIIEDEIGNNWSQTNAHGVDLQTCLLWPEQVRYFDPLDNSKTYDLWLVLEECPKTGGGYKIVFDEISKRFGLALRDQDGRDLFLGFYGTFQETFNGM